MKICVLVKEVPAAAPGRRLDPATGCLDRSGEKRLNPFDAHAIEAAVQLREAAATDIGEIVAVTMGPPSATRVLQKAMSLGADRSIHLTDESLAGSDLCATGYALAQVLRRESPDLTLLGQQSEDGECYALGAVVAEHLRMPSLTQVVKLELGERRARCRRQTEYGYETVDVDLPAVISVAEGINQPRYPSLKAILGAKELALRTCSIADAEIDAARVGERGSRSTVLGVRPLATHERDRRAREIIEGDDPDRAVEDIIRWLDERELLP